VTFDFILTDQPLANDLSFLPQQLKIVSFSWRLIDFSERYVCCTVKGSYCIFKKGECPKYFSVGSVYWDDAAPFLGRTSQTSTGLYTAF